MRRARWPVLALALLVVLAGLWTYRARDYRPVYARVAGELVAVHDSTGVGRTEDGKRVVDVTLVSDTGFEVRLRVRAPGEPTGEVFPAALLVGGFRTGRRAVQVPTESANLVLASVEYPYDGPRGDLPVWQWLRWLPAMRQAALDTPAALLLAAQYLYSREDVDADRVSIVGASLGVPFAVAAAATDQRLAGAALLHGGGDIRHLYSTAFAGVVDDPWRTLAGIGLEWLLAPLEPTKYAAAIAPRPLLMVNATGDELVPRESVLALYRAAARPKRLVWFESAHLATSDEELVDDLMDATLEWMAERGLR